MSNVVPGSQLGHVAGKDFATVAHDRHGEIVEHSQIVPQNFSRQRVPLLDWQSVKLDSNGRRLGKIFTYPDLNLLRQDEATMHRRKVRQTSMPGAGNGIGRIERLDLTIVNVETQSIGDVVAVNAGHLLHRIRHKILCPGVGQTVAVRHVNNRP